MKQKILSHLSAECPWRDTLHWFNSIDSTNTKAKRLARQGAPQGTVLIAGTQTAGRGRMGRSFSSPEGMGVYLSVILRPSCGPEKLMHLTCAAAVAMCEAVESAAGICPGIKWTNDLVIERRKLGGILTELSVDPKSGLVEYAIIGIGINCRQKPEDFSPELRDMATSLSMACEKAVSPARLAAAMVTSLAAMSDRLLTEKAQIMAAYRDRCITLGQDIAVLRGGMRRCGTALDLDPDGGLIVRFTDGSLQSVSSGEVSIRGMYGYL